MNYHGTSGGPKAFEVARDPAATAEKTDGDGASSSSSKGSSSYNPFIRSRTRARRRTEAPAGYRDAYKNRSFWETVSYSWATSLVNLAFKREIDHDELTRLDDPETTEAAAARLRTHWAAELALPPKKRSFWRAVRRAFAREIACVFALKMCFLAAVLVTNAWFLPALIRVLRDAGEPAPGDEITVLGAAVPWRGLLYAGGFLLSETARSLSINAQWYRAVLLGIRVRAAARDLLFCKVTRMRAGRVQVGTVINFFTNDTQRMLDAGNFGIFIVTTPIILCAIGGVLTVTFGPSVLAGLALMVCVVPVQWRVGKMLGAKRRAAVRHTDRRVNLMAEILAAVKLIKLYAWEARFDKQVRGVRAKEVAQLRRAGWIKSANNVMGRSVPVMVTVLTFVVHMWRGERLDVANAFSVLALFNAARFPLSVLAVATRFTARRDSAEDFSRLDALIFTAMAWIFIPAYCFAIS